MAFDKPVGIDLLAIIITINGIFSTFSGLDALFFASFLKSTAAIDTNGPGLKDATISASAVWGGIILAIGLASFFAAYGLYRGRSWGWGIAMALSIAGIIVPLINVFAGYWPSIFTILLSAGILYYLTRHEVRAFFARAAPTRSGAAAA